MERPSRSARQRSPHAAISSSRWRPTALRYVRFGERRRPRGGPSRGSPVSRATTASATARPATSAPAPSRIWRPRMRCSRRISRTRRCCACGTRCRRRAASMPETIEHARQHAPSAFRRRSAPSPRPTGKHSSCAATCSSAADSTCSGGAATLRWTGSWLTIFLHRRSRERPRPSTPPFEQTLRDCLERYRMAGQDLEVDAPRFVPLEIAMHVCVKPGYLFEHVEQALLDVLQQSHAARRPPRRVPSRQLHVRPAGLPQRRLRGGAGGRRASTRFVITTFQRQGIDSDDGVRLRPARRSGGSRSRGSTTIRTSPSAACSRVDARVTMSAPRPTNGR